MSSSSSTTSTRGERPSTMRPDGTAGPKGRQCGTGVEGACQMAKKKPKPRTRARRSSPRPPTPDQRQLDLIGLALVAVGVFLAFLLYGDWQGGKAGEGLVDALALAI